MVDPREEVATDDPLDAVLSEDPKRVAAELDDFRVLDSDTSDRVITKAVVARNARRIGDSLAAFEEYGRRIPSMLEGAG